MSLRSKTLFTLLAVAIAVPATSFASWIPNNSEQGGTEVQDSSSMKSRAQVLQELEQAKAGPNWAARQGEATAAWRTPHAESTKSRAQVQQESRTLASDEKAYIRSFYTGA